MDLQHAIEGDDSKEFHRLFENTLRDGGESSKSDKLQAAAIHCIRQNSLKCLTHIVNKMGQKNQSGQTCPCPAREEPSKCEGI
jgi:hypothetical protein